MDQFENQPQPSEPAQDSNGTSRRNFLKVAVVSSAAAAAAVGGAGVAATALSSRNSTGLSKLFVLNTNLVSTTNACFTHSGDNYPDNTPGNPFNSTTQVFFFAWFSGLSDGDYTVSLNNPSSLPSWLAYAPGNNNAVTVFDYTGKSGCPTDTSNLTSIKSGSSLPVTFTISGQTGILVWLQLHATNAPSGEQFTMTIEVAGGSYDVTATDTAYFVS